MSPQVKRVVYAAVVAVAVGLLGVLQQYVAHFSPAALSLVAPFIASALAYVNAWGHKEHVDELVAQRVTQAVNEES